MEKVEVTPDNIDELVETYADVYLSYSSIMEKFGIHRNNLSRWVMNGEIRQLDTKKLGPRGTWKLCNVADALIARSRKRKQNPFLRVNVNGIELFRCNGCLWWTGRGGYYENPSPRSAEHGLLTKCKLCYNEYGRRQSKDERACELKRQARNNRVRRFEEAAKANREYVPVTEVSATIFVWYLDTYSRGSAESVEKDTGIPARTIRRIRKAAENGKKVEVATIDRLLSGLGRNDLSAKFLMGLDRSRPPWHHKWPYCQRCYRTTRVHMAKGLCATCYRHRDDPSYLPMSDNGGWSQRYACCVICERTDSRHAAHGECHRCMQRERMRKRRNAEREVGSGHGNPRSPLAPT